MSIKTKIITTVVCICCIVSAMVVGILAASTQTFNISGSRVSFTSNQIAFRLEYLISGNVDANGNVNKPVDPLTGYSVQEVSAQGTTKPWPIDNINFDSTGSPIYIEISVMLHPTEEISQDVLVSFKEDSEIVSTAQGDKVQVSFTEIVQRWRDTTNGESRPYERYIGQYDREGIKWTNLATATPSGLTTGLNNEDSKNGMYTLIIKLEPVNTSLNFDNIGIDFELNFGGVGNQN